MNIQSQKNQGALTRGNLLLVATRKLGDSLNASTGERMKPVNDRENCQSMYERA